MGNGGAPAPPSDSKSMSPRSYRASLKNMCGLSVSTPNYYDFMRTKFITKYYSSWLATQYFNREVSSDEMVYNSRVFNYPKGNDLPNSLVVTWRTDDFNLKDDEAERLQKQQQQEQERQQAHDSPSSHSKGPGPSSPASAARATFAANLLMSPEADSPDFRRSDRNAAADAQARKLKHRNLAGHLAIFSASKDFETATFNIVSIGTFVNLAESDDPTVVSHCVVALSNICSRPSIRALLVEANAIMKFSNMIQLTRGRTAIWAAALLFYYFSCDSEVEDRVYNTCSQLLQVNGLAADPEIRLVTLYTMSNLMPCIDRARITDCIMSIYKKWYSPSEESDRNLKVLYLQILLNSCAFSNNHTTLIADDVLELLAECTRQVLVEKDKEQGLYIAKILQSFLVSQDTIGQSLDTEYASIFVSLMKLDDMAISRVCMRSLAFMSGIKTLLLSVCESDVVVAVSTLVDTIKAVPMDVAKDAAKYLANICQPISKEYLHRLVVDSVPVAIMQLTRHYKTDLSVQRTAIRGLQNILSNRNNVTELIEMCFIPLIRMMKECDDPGAVQCMYNIASVPECVDQWLTNGVHKQMLECMCGTKNSVAKALYLPVLVQMCANSQCVSDLLGDDIIGKIEHQLLAAFDANACKDLAKLILAIVSSNEEMQETQLHAIGRILHAISKKTTDERVIGFCATSVAFMSLILDDFTDVDNVLRAIISESSNDTVMEGAASVMYNITCSERSLPMLLKDKLYINIMIRLMRSGVISVQENVALAMRNICARPNSIDILVKADALADMIVIALLRTSSMEIKEVCAEAFYNMLCHPGTRLRLLNGESPDIWWAISRLSKHDSPRIRQMCANVLYDLSISPEYTESLRHHHILSFVRDLTMIAGSDEFFEVCLKAVINIVGHFQTDFANHEVLSALHIATAILTRCEHPQSIRSAISLMLKCIQVRADGADVAMVNLEIVHVFEKSIPLWSLDSKNKRDVANICYELARSDYFTRMINLQDLSNIWAACYQLDTDASPMMCQYISSSIFHYINREQATPEVVVSLNVWSWILPDAFNLPRSILGSEASAATISSQLASLKLDSTANKRRPGTADVYPLPIRAIVIAVIAFAVTNAKDFPHKFVEEIVHAVITEEHITNAATKENLLFIIHNLSAGNEKLARYLASSRIYFALRKYLATETRNTDRVLEFCCVTLLNLSLQPKLIETMITPAGNGLDVLITEILDYGGDNPERAWEITTVFYKAVMFELRTEFVLNPRYVLNSLNTLASKVPHEEIIIRVGKFVISVILDKYSKGIGVNPSFVQSLFTELVNNTLQDVPLMMGQVVIRQLDYINMLVATNLLKFIQPTLVTLDSYPAREGEWTPFISLERKRLENLMVNIMSQEPVTYSKLEPSDLPPASPFEKFVHSFDKIEIDESEDLTNAPSALGNDHIGSTAAAIKDDDDDEIDGVGAGNEHAGDGNATLNNNNATEDMHDIMAGRPSSNSTRSGGPNSSNKGGGRGAR